MRKPIFFSAALLSVILLCTCGTVAPRIIIAPQISNPFPQLADVQLVGCYGNRSTATVEFVFTVTAHSNLITSATFGQSPNTKFAARGKKHIPHNSAGTAVELVRYHPSDVVISNVSGVSDYLVRFDRIELQWYFNPSYHSGKAKQNLMFYDVPIVWE